MQDFRFRFCGEIIRVFIFTFGRFNDKSRWVLEGEGMILASCSFLIRSPSFQKQNIWITAAASAVFQIEDSCFYLLCSFGNLYLILIFYKANMVVVAYIVGKKISIAESSSGKNEPLSLQKSHWLKRTFQQKLKSTASFAVQLLLK